MQIESSLESTSLLAIDHEATRIMSLKRLAPALGRFLPAVGILLSGNRLFAQGPSLPGASGDGLPWQVAVLFTVNWVLVAAGVAMMSRPSKRAEKPKKPIDEQPV